MQTKTSIRFYNDREVRAVWNEQNGKWLFSAVDICASIGASKQPRKYWNDLKRKLIKENSQLSEKIGQLKLQGMVGKVFSTFRWRGEGENCLWVFKLLRDLMKNCSI